LADISADSVSFSGGDYRTDLGCIPKPSELPT